MKRREGGFTLLELLVSVGLLALLVLSLSLIFANGLKVLHMGYDRAEMYSNARKVLDQMLREIPSAICDGTNGYPFIGRATGSPMRGAESIGPELYFVGQVPGAGNTNVVELGYWLRNQTPTPECMRFYVTDGATDGYELYTAPYAPDFTTPAGSASSSLLGENITNLNFTYFFHSTSNPNDANFWGRAQSWDSRANNVVNLDSDGKDKNPDGLPDAVEVTVTVRDKLQKEAPQTLTAFIALES